MLRDVALMKFDLATLQEIDIAALYSLLAVFFSLVSISMIQFINVNNMYIHTGWL